jgi:Fe-S oxidoreductase
MRGGCGRPVLLYPDVFNDHFYPETLKAALTVLKRFGYHVIVPPGPVPAIRPLLHFGLLDEAERQIRQVLHDLRPYVVQGVPIIGLEPSTVSIFRDEVPNLLPHDRDGQRMRENCYLLSEFLDAQGVGLPRLHRQAILHNHCHQKAVLNPNAMRNVLTAMGIQFEEPEQGCCGMAGSFGFEAEHYDISQRLSERHLLPAARQAATERFVVAEGFSCRTQIQEATDRRPLHLAELLMMAFEAGPSAPDSQYPERQYMTTQTPMLKASTVALVGGAALLGGIVAARALRRRHV